MKFTRKRKNYRLNNTRAAATMPALTRQTPSASTLVHTLGFPRMGAQRGAVGREREIDVAETGQHLVDLRDNRSTLGCVVVPVAFYLDVVEPLLGRSSGVVYVLPETGSVRDLIRSAESG